ncbi:AT-rich interactive domain-containing protein 4A-like, partial [Etheostoma cragini]|uniref:AT-rich interactive domain-containing protein 4A-like n=1 Tax=Etheostoma cragini TaxID=417921 RepID=UPI00155DFB0E
MASPPRSVLKRQDEPMVVLHCLPTQRLPPSPPAPPAGSDTDSASEEEEEAEPELRSAAALKRKAAEQRTPEKRLRTDTKTLRGGEGGAEAEDTPRTAGDERLTCHATTETEMHAGCDAGTPPPALEDRVSVPAGVLAEPPSTAAPPQGPFPAEDLEPQLGPEALVCHEVDLDEPDEKDKSCTAPEQLLLMMRESQPAPPPLLPPLLNVSPLPPQT